MHVSIENNLIVANSLFIAYRIIIHSCIKEEVDYHT
jgi:hypothetical protein